MPNDNNDGSDRQQQALLAQARYALVGAATTTAGGAREKTPGQRTEAQLLQRMINRVMRENNIRESDLRR